MRPVLQRVGNVRLYAVIFLLVVLSLPAFAQYELEWSVQQDFYERGVLYFDFNEDGSQEITKYFLNSIWVYDGADSFRVSWSVTDQQHDELILWDLYSLHGFENKIALFLANDVLDQISSQVLAYEVFGDEPLWDSQDFSGYYSNLVVDNLNEDPTNEIILGVNEFDEDDDVYVSQFVILDSRNGNIEFESEWFVGYMVGPYTGDLDNDETIEIMFNLYSYADSTSELRVYSNDARNRVQPRKPTPRKFQIQQNFPNPFNRSTLIPINLPRQADIDVRIYNAVGRAVHTILQGRLSAGRHQFLWDGRNADGKPVESGAYFYEVQVDGSRYRKPLIYLK